MTPDRQCSNVDPHDPHTWNAIDPAAMFRTGENDWRRCAGVPDQTARHDGLGVDVWRCGRCAELPGETKWFESPDAVCPYDHEPGTRRNEPGKWFPTDAEALAEMREVAEDALRAAGLSDGVSNYAAVRMLRALGLTT